MLVIQYWQKKYRKKAFKYVKIWFSSLDFVDDIPKDPLTDGDGYLNSIKVYLYEDDFSIGDPLSKLAH